jgi:hypothetical protein
MSLRKKSGIQARGTGILIQHIKIGFAGVVSDSNFGDSHRLLHPFGIKWGRGILVKGDGYLEAITGPYGTSHSALKNSLGEDETTAGAFYFGFDGANRTLYFEYASDRMFEFRDPGVLDAIMASLREGSGPFKGFVLGRLSVE